MATPKPHPIFLYSKLTLHWGFIVRQLGASAAQLAYILPPPPTVVGAFLNPLARILGLGEEVSPKAGPAGSRAMRCALQATLAASAGLTGTVGVTVSSEPSRISAALYKTGGDYSKAVRQPPYLAADRLLPVQAEGYAASPGAKLTIAWLLDSNIFTQCLKTEVSIKELELAAWSVYRIGSREGIASVEKARVVGPESLEAVNDGGSFESVLYQPVECVDPEPRAPVSEVTLYNIHYRESLYYVPSLLGGPIALAPSEKPAGFTLKGGCKGVRPSAMPELTLTYSMGVV